MIPHCGYHLLQYTILVIFYQPNILYYCFIIYFINININVNVNIYVNANVNIYVNANVNINVNANVNINIKLIKY